MHRLSRFGAPLLITLLSAGHALADVNIASAYVRATPPGVDVTSAYFRISNTAGSPVILKGASADKATTVELHTHSEQDGVMQMRQIDQIVIPARQTHKLAPGGDHLMLIGLTEPLVEGDSVELTLQFSPGPGKPVVVTVPVRSALTELEIKKRIDEKRGNRW